MRKHIKADNTIRILINGQGFIYYSSIDKDNARKRLDELGIKDRLPAVDTFSFTAGDNSVTIDKFTLNNEDYYLVLIQPQGVFYKYAYMDPLTSLYNRNYWEHLISGVLQHPIPGKFTLIVIDIDNLKSINDNKGHLVGDKAIYIVGKSIKESIRKRDIAIRYGGDEFLILLANTKRFIVEKVLKRIKKNIKRRGEKENTHIEISAGTACSDSVRKLEKAMTMADYNMYKEKKWKKVRAGQIGNELEDIKKIIESVIDKLDNNMLQESKLQINDDLQKLSVKLDMLITKNRDDVQ